MVHCPLQNLELELTDHMISISELKTTINYRTFVNLLDVYFPYLNILGSNLSKARALV